MNYLFHSSLSLSTPSRAIMYDEALKLSREGHVVRLLYCDGLMSQCFINICGNSSKCSLCKSYYRSDKRRLGKQINFVPMTSLVPAEQRRAVSQMGFQYQSIDELKQLSYNGINIGLGVFSGYVSQTRNLYPLLDSLARFFFDECLRNSVLTILSVQHAVDTFSPNHIMLYNGRFADNRPVWEFSQSKNIPYTTLEAVYGVSKNFKSRFNNSTPHSPSKITELIHTFWDNSLESDEDRIKIGASFFALRRNIQYSGDKIYTAGQQPDLMPDGWDSSKHNIVIFNSSEDEFAAIGDAYDRYALFSSQMEGLKYIKEQLRERRDIYITLRIHPNLSNISYSYAQDLLLLQGGNTNVIAGDDPISTYALLDAADTIVVFGSTIGVEAIFWGKPTILLAGSQYYDLGICYIPNSPEELTSLLTKKLVPKEKEGAIRYGYFLMNEDWESPAVLDFDWSYWPIKLFGKTKYLELNNWLKLFGSRKLYTLMNSGCRFIYQTLNRLKSNGGDRFTLPRKEAPSER